MDSTQSEFVPPFCPNERCVFHHEARGWHFKKKGFFSRAVAPHEIQRYRCSHCGRSFSSQTFSTTYWLRRSDLPRAVFLRLLACSAFRQIARDLGVSPTTVLRHSARLGRHCLLFHERLRPKDGPLGEALTIDGFESFEFSQYTPIHLHTAVGAASHFVYGATDSELRRKGRMTERQHRRRAELELRHGRPDPHSIEREMRALLALVVPPRATAEIRSDDHPAYPRALAALADRRFVHVVTSSRVARTPANPLFPANLLDLLIRHSSANHKRETIAFSKRRQSAIDRLFLLIVWRNTMKPFSERRQDATPAQRLGLLAHRLTAEDVLTRRLFPNRIPLPERWVPYYWRRVPTRRIPKIQVHRARYAA